MTNLLWSGFIMMVLLSGCGWNGTPTRNNDITPLTSIEIVAVAPTIAAHTSTRLSATGNYSGLFTRDITDKVVWSSGSPNVAGFVTPALPSRVTGITPGIANLTATVGNVSATFKLTISPATVTGLTITPAAPTIASGANSQFTASGTFSDGTTQDLTFDAGWISSAPAVATVSNDSGSKGLVRALAAGTATITATFDSGAAVASTLLTVTTPTLQSIAVSPANPTILSISKVPFKALGTYSDGSTADISTQVAWNSSNTGFATIDTSGTVKTLVPGTTSISATLTGVSGTSNVKVTGGVLSSITVSPANPKLVKNTTVRLTAMGNFNNNISRDITGAVDWSVDVPSVATVTTPGGNQAWLNPLVLSSGTIVKATSGLVIGDATLAVVAPQLQDITLAPTSLELTTITSDRFRLTALYTDGTTQDVTAISNWSSSAVTTAIVGNTDLLNKGRVTGVAIGPAVISATFGGITKPANVTVRTRTLSDLTITGTPSATVGKQITFTATASYTDGSPTRDVTADTSWSIDNTNVAILADPLNQPGQVVMVDGGTATLTASFGNKTKTVTLTPLAP